MILKICTIPAYLIPAFFLTLNTPDSDRAKPPPASSSRAGEGGMQHNSGRINYEKKFKFSSLPADKGSENQNVG
jgi:hypothetical protein